MDGASKFVKGDAIAGLIITLVNLVAGIIIGMSMMGMTAGRAQTFSILTVGDGLVSQMPSLLIAIASGMLVTKARSDTNIGQELPRQFVLKSKALPSSARAWCWPSGVVPGMPLVPFAIIARHPLLHLVPHPGHRAGRRPSAKPSEQAEEAQGEQAEEKVEDQLGRRPHRRRDRLSPDPPGRQGTRRHPARTHHRSAQATGPGPMAC